MKDFICIMINNRMTKERYCTPQAEEIILLDILMFQSSSLEKPEEGGEWDDFDTNG